MSDNLYEKLSKIDVNEHVKTKNGLSYLPWAWAWGVFKKHAPDATYKILEREHTDVGVMVWTEITANGETHCMWLPVMDHRNKAITKPDMFDINKSIMRCLTKNISMFGLGLYIYAGEDLPQEPELEDQWPKEQRGPAVNKIIKKLQDAKSSDEIMTIKAQDYNGAHKGLIQLGENELADKLEQAYVDNIGDMLTAEAQDIITHLAESTTQQHVGAIVKDYKKVVTRLRNNGIPALEEEMEDAKQQAKQRVGM